MRIEATNPWSKSLEPQRSDLWYVDMKDAVDHLVDNEDDYCMGLIKTHRFYATNVVFPELAVGPEISRQDSRLYNYPGADVAMGIIRITFIHDVAKSVIEGIHQSEIYRLLDLWRARVRGGRGQMSKEDEILLNDNFKVPRCRFDMTVRMGCGYPLKYPDDKPMFFDAIATEGQKQTTWLEPSVEVSSVYLLKSAWLSSFQLADIGYDSPGIHKISAVFYAKDIVQEPK